MCMSILIDKAEHSFLEGCCGSENFSSRFKCQLLHRIRIMILIFHKCMGIKSHKKTIHSHTQAEYSCLFGVYYCVLTDIAPLLWYRTSGKTKVNKQ